MPRRPDPTSGFTLIELILVLVLLGIMMALAAPTLRGWGQGQKLRNAADEFVAATGYARSEAVAHAAVFAVEVDAKAGTYSVKSVGADQTRTAVPGTFGQNATLPTDYTLTLVKGGDAGGAEGSAAAIVFYPDGRVTPATVEFKSPTGQSVTVASDNPAEPFRRVEAKS